MRATTEKWLPIVGYEGMYEVSNHGMVRSLDRVDCIGRHRKGKILSPNNAKYVGINLVRNGSSRFVRVAKLVADAFLGERPIGCEIHHKDADTHNNGVDNLEYVTHKRNMEHSGAAGHRGKFSLVEVQAIFSAYQNGATITELASQYSVRRGTISDMLVGRSYRVFLSSHPSLAPVGLRGVKKLSIDTAKEIRKKYNAGGESYYTLGREYGVHPTTIRKIVTGARRADSDLAGVL